MWLTMCQFNSYDINENNLSSPVRKEIESLKLKLLQMSRFWHFIWLICVSNVTVECQSCSILLKTAFCSNICTNVAAEHYDKKIEIVEIIEPNKGDPFIVNLDCLMYFPKAKVIF